VGGVPQVNEDDRFAMATLVVLAFVVVTLFLVTR
jgi:hypothetical protein